MNLSVVWGLVLFLFAEPTTFFLVSGIVITLLGIFVRVWSSGYIQKNESVIIDGPYSLTRNPLYLGNFFIGLGFSIMSGRLFLAGAFFILFPLIYLPTIFVEEKMLLNRFGQQYLNYVQRVPRLFPRFKKVESNERKFSWKLVRDHREYHAWLAIVSAVFLLTLKMIWVRIP